MALLILTKATINAPGQHTLFPAAVSVRGHVRGNVFIRPHTATRRKAIEPAPNQPGANREALQAELKEVEGKISDAYWRFSRSSSSRVGPPPAELYARRKQLREALGLRTDGRLPGDPPPRVVTLRSDQQ